MRVLVLLALAIASPATAQQAQVQSGVDETRADEIVVTGVRTGRLNLERLLKAEAIFRANRATYAPGSTLYLRLSPRRADDFSGLTLTLRNGEQSIAVPIDTQGRFTLPELPGDLAAWELVHNRANARIAIRAVVLSPGASETDRPLGDLRLQCRVGWELLKPQFSIFARGAFDMVGGCDSRMIQFKFYAPRPLTAATVTDGTRVTALPLDATHRRFRAPLADRKLPNAARVRLTLG